MTFSVTLSCQYSAVNYNIKMLCKFCLSISSLILSLDWVWDLWNISVYFSHTGLLGLISYLLLDTFLEMVPHADLLSFIARCSLEHSSNISSWSGTAEAPGPAHVKIRHPTDVYRIYVGNMGRLCIIFITQASVSQYNTGSPLKIMGKHFIYFFMLSVSHLV